MSEEEKKETSNEESKAEETSKEESKVEETSSADSEYEKQLEQLREERDNLQKALQEKRAAKKSQEEEEDLSSESSVDIDAVKKELLEEQDRKIAELRMEQGKSLMQEELSKVSNNPKEQELIMEHYKRTIKPSGLDAQSIRRDLLLCKAAANINHLSFSNASGADAQTATALHGQGAGKVSEAEAASSHNLTSEEKAFLAKYGASADSIK